MDEATERRLLEAYAAALGDRPAARVTPGMAEVARRLRLEVAEHDYVLEAGREVSDAMRVIAGMGHVLEESTNEVVVVVKVLFLSHTIVSASTLAQAVGQPAIHLRAAALEGRWSWHTSARVLKKLRRLLDDRPFPPNRTRRPDMPRTVH